MVFLEIVVILVKKMGETRLIISLTHNFGDGDFSCGGDLETVEMGEHST